MAKKPTSDDGAAAKEVEKKKTRKTKNKPLTSRPKRPKASSSPSKRANLEVAVNFNAADEAPVYCYAETGRGWSAGQEVT